MLFPYYTTVEFCIKPPWVPACIISLLCQHFPRFLDSKLEGVL